MLTLTYIHDHPCIREGELYVARPDSKDGVAHIVPPTCEEFGAQLRLVGREQH